jgi:hypothetical protein
MNVDAEIYIRQIFHFFDSNPEQLEILIGKMSKEKFYEKIKTRVYKHVDSGNDELELTRQEMVDLIQELYLETQNGGKKVNRIPFIETEFGLVGLN